MSSFAGPTSWYESLQPPLSEAVIIDWVDGAIDDDAGRQLALAAGRPDVIQRVAAMKRMRGMLQTLPMVEAPGTLVVQALAATEMTARDGGGFVGALETAIPSIGGVPASRGTPYARFALAACATLAAMVAVYVSQPAKPSAPPVLAANGAADEVPAHLVLDADRALQLAREGRLLVRVAVNDSSASLPPIEASGSIDTPWSVDDQVSPAMLEAVRPYFTQTGGVMHASETGPNEGRFLTAEMFGPPSSLGADQVAMGDSRPDAATYVVQVDADAAAFAGFKSSINSRMRAGVLFEELPKPMPGARSSRTDLSVPVIVQRR